MLRDEVLEVLKSGRVDYVRVVFADILGNSRGRSLRRIEFEKSLNKGIEYSEALLYLDYKDTPIKQRYGDIFAVPDISTFVLIPYLERTARVLSFLTTQDNSPHPLCTRSLLTRSIDKLGELGYNIKVAFEPTFYLINFKDGKPVPADEARAFSSEGLMEQQNFLRDLIKYLESVNIQVQYINKHYAPGQYEITFSMGEALEEADSLITAREIIRDTARLYHLYSTFMPKPFKEYPSSSMDIYIKLVDTQNKSVGVDTSDPRGLGLSKILYSFLAGILEHISSILAIAAPTINSYKRYREVVTPNVAGIGNERHFIIRIPSTYRDLGVFEFRLADPLANPYLLLSSMIFAGIDGIEKGLDVDVNYEVSTLPTNLKEALYKLDSDTKLKYYLGKELVDTFIELKKKEIEDYEKEITEWEINSYLKSGW
ncbi:glutamine synthetase family protein [Sulfurisphaera ohwakuensis]|uniref:Glutamine synthetase n=1 Tax=Sulfurisphaera ohwakuensis TaxID=69656 RepID=A0A650CKM9_SULOH|nr:glutamine synthetase family protein [Sulfurisphaera ohwakuensis]QGR18400.1 glutamine synthetase [Sulfurisphaera ohwakuensis]